MPRHFERRSTARFCRHHRAFAGGRIPITIGEVETLAGGPGERLFDVSVGDQVLAKDFDIFVKAGGAERSVPSPPRSNMKPTRSAAR